uniref:Uncharacterized protein n=1 Tax=Solanum tuberosum TaxID=4113 RepID=M1DBZ4_SOLTU
MNSRSWVESRHVGSLGELGRARRITQRFAEVLHFTFNFMLYLLFDSVTFGEKLEVAKGTRRVTESLLDLPLSALLSLKLHCNFRWANPCSPNSIGDSPKGLPIADMPKFYENCLANPFGQPDLVRQSDSATR